MNKNLIIGFSLASTLISPLNAYALFGDAVPRAFDNLRERAAVGVNQTVGIKYLGLSPQDHLNAIESNHDVIELLNKSADRFCEDRGYLGAKSLPAYQEVVGPIDHVTVKFEGKQPIYDTVFPVMGNRYYAQHIQSNFQSSERVILKSEYLRDPVGQRGRGVYSRHENIPAIIFLNLPVCSNTSYLANGSEHFGQFMNGSNQIQFEQTIQGFNQGQPVQYVQYVPQPATQILQTQHSNLQQRVAAHFQNLNLPDESRAFYHFDQTYFTVHPDAQLSASAARTSVNAVKGFPGVARYVLQPDTIRSVPSPSRPAAPQSQVLNQFQAAAAQVQVQVQVDTSGSHQQDETEWRTLPPVSDQKQSNEPTRPLPLRERAQAFARQGQNSQDFGRPAQPNSPPEIRLNFGKNGMQIDQQSMHNLVEMLQRISSLALQTPDARPVQVSSRSSKNVPEKESIRVVVKRSGRGDSPQGRAEDSENESTYEAKSDAFDPSNYILSGQAR